MDKWKSADSGIRGIPSLCRVHWGFISLRISRAAAFAKEHLDKSLDMDQWLVFLRIWNYSDLLNPDKTHGCSNFVFLLLEDVFRW